MLNRWNLGFRPDEISSPSQRPSMGSRVLSLMESLSSSKQPMGLDPEVFPRSQHDTYHPGDNIGVPFHQRIGQEFQHYTGDARHHSNLLFCKRIIQASSKQAGGRLSPVSSRVSEMKICIALQPAQEAQIFSFHVFPYIHLHHGGEIRET